MSIDVGTLTLTCALLVALTVRAVARLVRKEHATALTGVGAVLLWAALGTLAGYHEVRHHDVQAAATTATRHVSENPDATVTCQRISHDWFRLTSELGFVSWDAADTAVLRQSTCANLGAWMYGGRGSDDIDQVTAVHVVTHEAVHVAGIRDEAVTECVALELDATVAQFLGADPEQAQQLAETYRQVVYPRMGPDYRTDCTAVDVAAALANGG